MLLKTPSFYSFIAALRY